MTLFKSNKVLIFYLVGIINLAMYAEDIKVNEAELISYAVQKHRVDFKAQTDKSKSDIANEFVRNAKLGEFLLNGNIKEDPDFRVASRQIAIDIWAQKFMLNAQASDEALQELYKKHNPKMASSYKLRNILVKSDSDADKLIKSLAGIKGKEKQLEKFKQLVQSDSEDFVSRNNAGDLGWVEVGKMDPSIQAVLKDKKSGDIVKAAVAKIGTQVLLIEELKEQRLATFEEAKPTLTQLAKQELLNTEIKKILDSK
jgi:parvulin-like peptidyl-prolyl isomerase